MLEVSPIKYLKFRRERPNILIYSFPGTEVDRILSMGQLHQTVNSNYLGFYENIITQIFSADYFKHEILIMVAYEDNFKNKH